MACSWLGSCLPQTGTIYICQSKRLTLGFSAPSHPLAASCTTSTSLSMADPSTCPPLTPASIAAAHAKIAQFIHRTPLLTCKTLDRIASASSPVEAAASPSLVSSDGETAAGKRTPKFKLFFKCENFQRIGAFKPRGAFNALVRLIEEMGIEEVRRRGVIAHSSGEHLRSVDAYTW